MKVKLTAVVVLTVLAVTGAYISVFSPAAQETRAKQALNKFLASTPASVTQCVADTDGDGYSSCTYTLEGRPTELIPVQCTSSVISSIPYIGAPGCKAQLQELLKLR